MTTTAQNIKNKVQKILASMEGLDGLFAKHEFRNTDSKEDFTYVVSEAILFLEELMDIIDEDEGEDEDVDEVGWSYLCLL